MCRKDVRQIHYLVVHTLADLSEICEGKTIFLKYQILQVLVSLLFTSIQNSSARIALDCWWTRPAQKEMKIACWRLNIR